MATKRPPKLPELLSRKIYKTGQTRGADNDQIFQNRVSRSSTALIPYNTWSYYKDNLDFEKSFIVLINPADYFNFENPKQELSKLGLKLGYNLLVFYQTRRDWEQFPPNSYAWTPANSRTAPLGGEYVARIAATTSKKGGIRENHGYTESKMKGAGIRVYEYAHNDVLANCRLQLEALFWLCTDSVEAVVQNGMKLEDARTRRDQIIKLCVENDLLDYKKLAAARTISEKKITVCPLCLEEISAHGFFLRMAQAEGREVHDLTVTELNLFHIEELQTGKQNHRLYNLGWGHHHCNVVVKDAGIHETIEWMREVVKRNEPDTT